MKRIMTRQEYMECLKRLVRAIVAKHGEMTFQCLHERANQLIVLHGVDGAIEHV